ncbi:MAG TPA: universal stress protein [Steroidobacter sp.]|uniref:universal stress protein n=1 Tax=Steroidobacter sp. TaxID=1978227 RepID=UPI002EDB26DA
MQMTPMQMTPLKNESLQSAALPTHVPKRRILCATDLTARSARAMKRAAMLAQQMDAQAHFVHTVSDLLAGRVLRSKVNRAYARLTEQSDRLMRHAPYDCTAAIQLGKPINGLIEAARELNPDLIVMAQPKRRRLDAMIGTTAERVIRATGCSVLLTAGDAERPYERVVLATDLSPTSMHVTRTAVDMGVLTSAETWVVHAFGLPYHDIATSDSFKVDQLNLVDGLARQARWHEAARRDVLRNLDDAGADLERVHILTEQASAPNAIRRALDLVQPELLVIGVSRWFALKRILIGSVADQVFRSANCDVLAIAPAAAEKQWRLAA